MLIDGAVSLVRPGDTLRQVLIDWKTSAATAVNQRFLITYNTAHPSSLMAGRGRNWFFYADRRTRTNRKVADHLN